MKRVLIVAFAVGVLQAIGAVAFAHHSAAAVYDTNRTVDVEGIVREFRLVNPHAEMTLEVTSAAGNEELRIVEFDGRLNLTVGGWTPDTIKAGERVTVHGNPSRSDDGRIWFLSLERADGTELVRPINARIDAIDAQRRQRVQQRAQER